jgi:predicted ATP-binding protein involved in virulence
MADKPTTPPPAYFLSLSLENVRSFGEKQTISFARPDGRPAQWTIILGDNGVGKTTVLKALAGMSTKKDPLSDYRFPALASSLADKWYPIRFEGQLTGEIRANIQIGYKLEDKDYSPSLAETYHSFVDLPGDDSPNQPYGMGWSRLGTESIGMICSAYGASRTIGRAALSDTPEASEAYASLFDEHADLLNLEELFLQLDYNSKIVANNKSFLLQLDKVGKALLEALPDVEALKIKPSGTLQKPQVKLQFKTPYGWVGLRDMSLGYQTTIAWLSDFANKFFIRYPDSPNPLEEPAIVLIDEIDLHLHPNWQRKLIGFLSGIFKNTQFIATAHSPLVVQAAGDANANVVLLRREGDQTVVVKDLEDVRNWRIDQIMTSELFGLETARSPEAEEKLKRRAALLTKSRRTAAEKKELEALTQALDAEPLGELPSEREVDAVLQELRQRLQRKDASDPAAA